MTPTRITSIAEDQWLDLQSASLLSPDSELVLPVHPKQVGPALMKNLGKQTVHTPMIGCDNHLPWADIFTPNGLTYVSYCGLRYVSDHGEWKLLPNTESDDRLPPGDAELLIGEAQEELLYHSATPLVERILKSILPGLPSLPPDEAGHLDPPSSFRKSALLILESLLYTFIVEFLPQRRLLRHKELLSITSCFTKIGLQLAEIANKDNDEMTVTKYWSECELAKAFSDEQRPVRPAVVKRKLFKGWAAKMLARALSSKRLSVFYSLQKGAKQSWAKPSYARCESVAAKTLTRYSTYKGPVEPEHRQHIIRVGRGIWEQILFVPNKLMPTGSGCLEATKGSFGFLGTCRPASLIPTKVLDHPHLPCGTGLYPHVVQEVNRWRQETFDSCLSQLRDRNRRENLVSKTYWKGGLTSPCPYSIDVDLGDVESVQIMEPGGKARTVTIGLGCLYTFLQPVQGWLLECWKHSQWSTMLDSDLTHRVQTLWDKASTVFHLMYGVPKIVSGDFESATDNMKRDCTLACLESMRGLIPPEMQSYCEKSFQPGWLTSRLLRSNLEKKMKHFLPPDERAEFMGATHDELVRSGCRVWAIEGQAMGHPLSFPYLCVANLATYQKALTNWLDEVSEDDNAEWIRRLEILNALWDNVLVNGDDILFVCEDSFYPVWIRTAAEVGLIVSLGKNYKSPDTAMINSQIFQLRKNRWQRFGYLNQNLFNGCIKKTESSSPIAPTELARAVNQTLELEPRYASAIPRLMRRAKLTGSRPNWYLPVSAGGLGLNPKFGPHIVLEDGTVIPKGITREQRVTAAHFMYDPRLRLFTQRGMVIHLLEQLTTDLNHHPLSGNTSLISLDSYLSRNESRSDPDLIELLRRYVPATDEISVVHGDSVLSVKSVPSRNLRLRDLEKSELPYGTMSPEARRVVSLMGNNYPVTGSYVPNRHEVLSSVGDELSNRVMSLIRMGQSELHVDVHQMVTRIARQYRLKPASLERIAAEYSTRYFQISRPIAPVSPIDLRLLVPKSGRFGVPVRELVTKPQEDSKVTLSDDSALWGVNDKYTSLRAPAKRFEDIPISFKIWHCAMRLKRSPFTAPRFTA